MDANSVAVKIGFNGDLHRLRVDLNVFTLDELTRLFARTFGLAPGSFVIKYTDAEGDSLNVVSDAEFVEACRVFLSGNRDELKALKFTAVLREGGARLATAGTAADQLIDAVERLVVSLNTTVDKVRADDWKAVEATTAVLSQAAHEAHETLQATRQAMQEKRFEQVLEETSDGVKSAASGISSFAQRLVKNFIPEKKPEAVNQSQSLPPAPAVVQPEEKVEEAPAQQEQEEVVFTAVPEPEVAVPAPAAPVVAPVAFSEAEIKWAEQLGMIRGIFPDVETQNAINLLEANQGDVNVVINELMESIM